MSVHFAQCRLSLLSFFFFNDTATTEIYTLSLHDALPICLYSQPRDVFAGSPMAVQCCIVQGRGARLFSLVGELVIRSENGPDTFQGALLCTFHQFVQFVH